MTAACRPSRSTASFLIGADAGDALVDGVARADAGVPLPTTLALFALGLIGIGYQQRRAQRSA